VRLDNPPTDGQAHAGALHLGGEEGIDHLGGATRWVIEKRLM
jgi:hypothetical protein